MRIEHRRASFMDGFGEKGGQSRGNNWKELPPKLGILIANEH